MILADDFNEDDIDILGKDVYKAALENSTNAICIFNSNGSGIQYLNMAFGYLFGYTYENKNLELKDLINNKELSDEILHAITYDYEWKGELNICSKEEKNISTETNIATIVDDNYKSVGIILVATDISLRKKMEKELERSNKELESFAYTASHDLRAPLRGIKQLAEWIKEDIPDSVSGDVKHNLDLLENRVSKMGNLLEDLLKFAKIWEAEGDLEEVSLKNIIENIKLLYPVTNNISINFISDDLVFVTKATPLEQVLRNLISNAIKYHDKDNGIIDISYSKLDNYLEITVKDNGLGIKEENKDKIFEMFQRATENTKVEGNGLGLPMVKKIIESFGGSIRLESEFGIGSSFIFLWPKNIS